MAIDIKAIEAMYAEASKGAGTPNYAVTAVPGIGMVELARGETMRVDGREATQEEWQAVMDFVKKWKKPEGDLDKSPSPEGTATGISNDRPSTRLIC